MQNIFYNEANQNSFFLYVAYTKIKRKYHINTHILIPATLQIATRTLVEMP